MDKSLPTCCEYHGIDCSEGQGRACPAHGADRRERVLNRFHAVTDEAEPEPTSWEVITGLLRPVLLVVALICAAIALYHLAQWVTWPRLVYVAGSF